MSGGSHRSLWVGIALTFVGLAGLVAVLVLVPTVAYRVVSPQQVVGRFSSAGEQLFLTGTDPSGNPIPRSTGSSTGMMSGGFAGGGCADCHGTDGRGGTVRAMMGSFQAADIRWRTLSATTDESGQPQTPFDASNFARAVCDGVDPEGKTLDPAMPRWQLTDQQVQDLIVYLKTL